MSLRAAFRRSARQVGVVLVLVLSWELLSYLFKVSPEKLPAPSTILVSIWFGRAALAQAVWTTLIEAVTGLLGGVLIGVAIGVLFSRFRLLERMLLPYFVASQAVPIIAFGAIIIIWFGNGLASKALIAFYLLSRCGKYARWYSTGGGRGDRAAPLVRREHPDDLMEASTPNSASIHLYCHPSRCGACGCWRDRR